MSEFQVFLNNFNFESLLLIVIRVCAALTCITLHEMSHGAAALKLGDPTAKNRGRLSFNPIKHIDPFGLLLMIIAGVGWAKPVPVNPRYFKNPKKGMAITAAAGPGSNFVIAYIALLIGSLVYHILDNVAYGTIIFYVLYYILLYFCLTARLSIGLALFNIIPIPPLDGSKILFSILPNRVYYTILKYEKYVMLVVIAVTFIPAFSSALSACISAVLRVFCKIAFFPASMFGI